MREGGWCPVVALLTMLWWLLPLRCAASQHSIALSLSLVGPPLPVITRTYQPPYEQLLVAEGSGAVGVVSPLSPLSSCPALPVPVPVLVLVPLALVLASLLSLSPPLPSLPVLAHCHRGDGDRPISTRSTLQARARSGGRQVLGCSLILVVSARLA